MRDEPGRAAETSLLADAAGGIDARRIDEVELDRFVPFDDDHLRTVLQRFTNRFVFILRHVDGAIGRLDRVKERFTLFLVVFDDQEIGKRFGATISFGN
jgi:hypothetical protein